MIITADELKGARYDIRLDDAEIKEVKKIDLARSVVFVLKRNAKGYLEVNGEYFVEDAIPFKSIELIRRD